MLNSEARDFSKRNMVSHVETWTDNIQPRKIIGMSLKRHWKLDIIGSNYKQRKEASLQQQVPVEEKAWHGTLVVHQYSLQFKVLQYLLKTYTLRSAY